MASLTPSPKMQFFTASGMPLVGGKLYTYAAGTTTPLATYTDSTGTSANTNPVILDSRGEANVWLGVGSYKMVLKDSVDALIWTVDNILGAPSSNAALVALAASNGSSLVGFIQSGTGAVATTVQTKLRETVSVKDFGAGTAQSASVNVSSIQATIDDIKTDNGGKFSFDGFNYATSSELVVKGEFSRGLVIDGNDSKISFTQAGVGVRFGEYATPGGEYRLKTKAFNLNISGPGKTILSSVAVKVDETADVSAQGGIWSNAERGLWLNGGLICDFSEQVIRDCATGIVANTTTNFAPNSINFTSVRVIKNDLAVNYDGNANGVTNWYGCEIEANNESGTTTDGKVVTNLSGAGHHNLIGCHFESNKGQTSVKFTGASSAKNLMVLGCEMIDSSAGTGLDVNTGRATILSSRITGVTGINFGANGRGTLIDVEGTPAGTLGNVIGIRDGRLAFGKNPTNAEPLISATPAAIVAASNIVTDWQNDTIQMRWKNTAGTRVGYLQTSSAGDHILWQDNASGGWGIGAANSTRMYVGRSGALSVEPGGDNTTTLGSGSLRWSTVYAGTGTINTSDARTKQQVRSLTDAERAVAVRLKGLLRAFKFNDSVAEKGDLARIHFGVIAQDVKAAFEAESLVAEEYALLCHDTWPDRFDEKGALVQAAGDRYGVRYEQLLAFVIAAL